MDDHDVDPGRMEHAPDPKLNTYNTNLKSIYKADASRPRSQEKQWVGGKWGRDRTNGRMEARIERGRGRCVWVSERRRGGGRVERIGPIGQPWCGVWWAVQCLAAAILTDDQPCVVFCGSTPPCHWFRRTNWIEERSLRGDPFGWILLVAFLFYVFVAWPLF